MTPKEKADELYVGYWYLTNDSRIAKQCTMIAINQIIGAIDFDWMEVQNLESEHRYWDAVKQEIENYEK
jgi:hypothetical protein